MTKTHHRVAFVDLICLAGSLAAVLTAHGCTSYTVKSTPTSVASTHTHTSDQHLFMISCVCVCVSCRKLWPVLHRACPLGCTELCWCALSCDIWIRAWSHTSSSALIIAVWQVQAHRGGDWRLKVTAHVRPYWSIDHTENPWADEIIASEPFITIAPRGDCKRSRPLLSASSCRHVDQFQAFGPALLIVRNRGCNQSFSFF